MSDEPRFAWLTAPADEIIDSDHPDYAYWQETYAHEAMLSGEAPTALPEQPQRPAVPAVALAFSRAMAAEALSVSEDYLDKHVIPEIRTVNSGRKVLIPVRELERWLDEHAAFALKGR